MSPKARWTARAQEAGATLKSFSLTVRPDGSLTAGLDMEAAHGRADSGDLNEDAMRAQGVVESELDESFFQARIQRSTVEERRYMRAMAELGSTEQKASDVAEVLGKASEQIAPLRARLISKGLLYTPRYGYAKFTVPQFDRFMRRYMDLDGPQSAER